MRRRPLFLLCFVVLAGCGGGQAAAPPTTPHGFTVRDVADPGFSIALPRRWRSFDGGAVIGAKRLARDNPRLRAELQALSLADSPIKLIAFDPSSIHGFLTSMNVLQTQVPSSLSFEELSRIEARQVALVSAVKDLQQETTRLAAGPALRLRYRARSRAVVHQYFVRHEQFLYVLTYTTRRAAGARYAKIFDLSAHTFHIG